MSRKNGLVALSALFLIMVATPAIAAPMQDGGAATGYWKHSGALSPVSTKSSL